MDTIDALIAATLQREGRTTNVELARMNNLTPSATLKRMKRLEDEGVIKGYRAILEPRKFGYNLQALVTICLNRHNEHAIELFESGIQTIPEVKACFHVTGRYDYILQVMLHDIEHLGLIVKNKLVAIGCTEKIETMIVISMVKEDNGFPLDAISPNNSNGENHD